MTSVIILELIKVHREIENYDEAVAMCRELLSQDSGNQHALQALSHTLMDKERKRLYARFGDLQQSHNNDSSMQSQNTSIANQSNAIVVTGANVSTLKLWLKVGSIFVLIAAGIYMMVK